MCISPLSPTKCVTKEIVALAATLVAVIASTTGCTKSLQVEYISDPPGAWIFTNSGYRYGRCPFTVVHNVTKEEKEKGCVRIPQMNWLWIDCQEARSDAATCDLKKGYSWTVTQKIPNESPSASAYGRLFSSYRDAVNRGSEASDRMQFKVNYNQASYLGGGKGGYMNWGRDLADAIGASRAAKRAEEALRAYELQFSGDCMPSLKEEFDDNSGNWPTKDTPEISLQISGGKYIMTHKRERGSWFAHQRRPGLSKVNFEIECDVKHTGGVTDYGYGITFGLQDGKNEYHFVISADGSYLYGKCLNDKFSEIIPWTQSNLINQGNSINRLTIRRNAQRLVFLINGEIVNSATFETLPGDKVGLMVQSKQTVEFDNLVVRRIE